MGEKNTEEGGREHSAVDGLVSTLEWLIVAFATTLVFIVFEMQAYTIPTGSMADTLRGAHFRLRCPQCAYGYDYNFLPEEYRLPRNATPGVNVDVRPAGTRCPSCGYLFESIERRPVLKGDRIFVVKCLYQFAEPKRWDIIVFKNPLNPQENYIKRLIGLPGETVEIVDGDIYIDDRIARKPRRVQEELWMCVYDNDYQPVNPRAGNFNDGVWRQPFVNIGGSRWNLLADGPTVFSLDGGDDEVHTLVYDTRTGNDFKATYAYDDALDHPAMPICSDLMVRFDVRATDSSATAGIGLTKYGVEYRGRVDFAGAMRIEKVLADGRIEELAGRAIDIDPGEGAQRMRFANADHVLVLEFGDERLECDLGEGRDDAGARRAIMPVVKILASGGLKLFHLAIFRDTHYINFNISIRKGGRKVPILRADEGRPFGLNDDEFFVLGDNTPASLDCRWWDRPGSANGGRTYREGTVPRNYLVGKAFFVYWPGPYKPFNDTAIARAMERNPGTRLLKMLLNVPDVDGLKFLDGGSDD